MVNGQQSMVNSQWSTVNGQQSTVNSQWSMVNSQWSTVNGQQSMVNSQWSIHPQVAWGEQAINGQITNYLARKEDME